MRFGVLTPHIGEWSSREAIEKTAELAEKLEYNSIWVSDHIIVPTYYGKSYGYIFESLVTLSFLASKTENLTLGSSVIVLPLRDPIILAKQLATIDILSGGRLIAGFGSGWLKEEFDYLGKSYADRGKLMDSFIELMKKLWSNEKIELKRNGKIEFMFEPKPIQKGGPKILIGGNSRKAIIRAIKLADGWNPVALSPRILFKKIDFMKKITRGIKKQIYLRIECMPDTEKAFRRTKTDNNYYLSGTPRMIADDLEKFNEVGIDHIIVHFGSIKLDTYLDRMRKFKDVMRSFQN